MAPQVHSYLKYESRTAGIAWLFIGAYLSVVALKALLAPIYYWAAVGTIGLIFAACLMAETELGLFALIFFLPFDLFTSTEIYGYTLKTSQVVALLTSASLAVRKMREGSLSLVRTPLELPLGLFITANVCSLFYAADKVKGFLYLGWSVFMVGAVYLMMVNLITTRKLLDRCLKFLLLSAGAVGAFGVYQFIGDYLGLPTGLGEGYTRASNLIPRIQTVALEPLYWANYLLLASPIAMVSLIWGVPLIDRKWQMVLTLLLMFNLLFTVSRGGWIGMAASGGVMYLLYILRDGQNRLRKLKLPAYLAVAAAVLGVIFYLTPAGRESTLKTIDRLRQENFIITGEGDRLTSWIVAVKMFTTSPIIGLGVGNFGPSYHRYLPPRYGYLYEPVYEPLPAGLGKGITNNITLEILSETGVLGLSAYLGIICISLIALWRIFHKSEEPFWRMLSVGLSASFVGIFVQYQFFSTFYIMHVWFALGLIMAAYNIFRSETNAVLKTAPPACN